jgi:hypothetical protein
VGWIQLTQNSTEWHSFMNMVINFSFHKGMGRDSVVGTATHYGLDGDRIPVGARFSAPVQIGPGAHTASYTMGTGSLSRG